jgi:hypothetical protein
MHIEVLGYGANSKASSKSGQQQFDNSSRVDARYNKTWGAEEEDGASEDDDTDEDKNNSTQWRYFLVDVKNMVMIRETCVLLGGSIWWVVMYVG